MAIDAATGVQKWELDTGDGTPYNEDIHGPPTLGPDGTIYVTFGEMVAAFKDNGDSVTELWNFPQTGDPPELGGYTDFPTVGPDGTVYVPTGNGYLAAIKPPAKDPAGAFTGSATLKWAFQSAPVGHGAGFDIELHSQPAIAPDGTLFLGSDENRGRVWHIRDDGTEATVLAFADIDATAPPTCCPVGARHDVNAPPALDVARGQVYFASDDGNLHAFRMSDMTHLWAAVAGTSSGTPEDSEPAVAADGTIVVGSEDGNIYAINPDGTAKWMVTPCGGTGVEPSAAISSSGIVVIGSPCGLFAYRLASGGQLWTVNLDGDDIEFDAAIGPDGTIYYPIENGGGAMVVALTGTMGLPPEAAA
jgi:outer membrane protein assembly factor BamB